MAKDPSVGSDPPDDADQDDGDAWVPSLPDALDLVVEAGAMLAVFAAQQYVRIDAMRLEALWDAERYGYQLTDVIERSVRLEIASALSITEYAAGALITQADALVHRYPTVLDSLAGARVAQRHAIELVESLDLVEPEFRDQILPRAIALAESLPVGKFRRQLRMLIETVRVVTLEERHNAALEFRRVAVETVEDGMGWLHLYGPAVEVHAIHGRLTAMAKVIAGSEGEERSLDQLRADVMGDLLIDGSTDGMPGKARGIRATVVVTVPALALLHPNGGQGRVASVEGVGPIPMHRARELCGGAKSWMRVLTHPETGIVLSVGRKKYRPPPELRRLVTWRAETCMAPGCNISASRCEVDHNIPWETGGETSLANLTPLCKGHHIVKHHSRWDVQQFEGSGGVVRWTSPTGRVYDVQPERRVPVFIPAYDEQAPF